MSENKLITPRLNDRKITAKLKSEAGGLANSEAEKDAMEEEEELRRLEVERQKIQIELQTANQHTDSMMRQQMKRIESLQQHLEELDNKRHFLAEVISNKAEKKPRSLLLHRKIQAARLSAGIKHQKDLALRIGCTPGAVSQWEAEDPNKRTTPELGWIYAIAKETEIPASWLIEDGFAVEDLDNVKALAKQGRWTDLPVQIEPGSAPNTPSYTDAVEIEGLGVLLRTPEGHFRLPLKAKPQKLAQVAFGGVEHFAADADPDCLDHFKVTIPNAFEADYFDGRAIVEFVHFKDNFLVGIKRKIADLLFAEAMTQKPLHKMILAWGPTPEPHKDFDKADAICKIAHVELKWFTKADHGATLLRTYVAKHAE